MGRVKHPSSPLSATPLIVGMHHYYVSVMAEKCARRVVLRKIYVFSLYKAHAVNNVFEFCKQDLFENMFSLK